MRLTEFCNSNNTTRWSKDKGSFTKKRSNRFDIQKHEKFSVKKEK